MTDTATAPAPETMGEFVAPFIDRDELEEQQHRERQADGRALRDMFDESIAAIAVDNSGSTAGSVLRHSKAICHQLVGPRRTVLVQQRTVGWNDRVVQKPLDKLDSGGMTEPARLFEHRETLPHRTMNLLITTDGAIRSEDVDQLTAPLA